MYLAPEFLVEELCLSGASISDLMLADIWALGMVLFSMLNPSLKCPYLVEIREAGGVKSQEELKTFIRSLLRVRKHPTPDETYQVQRGTVWCALEEVYRGCVHFNRQDRLSLDKAVDIMRREENGYEVIPLPFNSSITILLPVWKKVVVRSPFNRNLSPATMAPMHALF